MAAASQRGGAWPQPPAARLQLDAGAQPRADLHEPRLQRRWQRLGHIVPLARVASTTREEVEQRGLGRAGGWQDVRRVMEASWRRAPLDLLPAVRVEAHAQEQLEHAGHGRARRRVARPHIHSVGLAPRTRMRIVAEQEREHAGHGLCQQGRARGLVSREVLEEGALTPREASPGELVAEELRDKVHRGAAHERRVVRRQLLAPFVVHFCWCRSVGQPAGLPVRPHAP